MAALGPPVPRYSGWLWTHCAKGGDYRMLGDAKLQTDHPLSDMAEVVIYQGADGKLWAREKHEFEARFSRTRPDAYGLPQPEDDFKTAVLRCRYPVCTTINPSGWGWDTPRLNEVIADHAGVARQEGGGDGH
jgi:hypothetical protein